MGEPSNGQQGKEREGETQDREIDRKEEQIHTL